MEPLKHALFVTTSDVDKRYAGDSIYSGQVLDGLRSLSNLKVEVVRITVGANQRRGLRVLAGLPLLPLMIFFPYMWLSWARYGNLLRVIRACRIADLIIVDHFRCAWVVILVRLIKISRKPTIIYISHNVESAVAYSAARERQRYFTRILFLYEAWKLLIWELIVYRFVSSASHITDVDLASSMLRCSTLDSVVLPPAAPVFRDLPSYDPLETPYDLIIVGSFEWSLKKLNLCNFLDTFRHSHKSSCLTLVIAGKVSADIRALGDTLAGRVFFHGSFESVTDVLRFGRIGLVIDSAGGGFKIKLLDYLSGGLPVIGIQGSMEGVPVSPGILHCENFEDVINVASAICHDIPLLQAMSLANRNVCEAAFGREKFNSCLARLLNCELIDL